MHPATGRTGCGQRRERRATIATIAAADQRRLVLDMQDGAFGRCSTAEEIDIKGDRIVDDIAPCPDHQVDACDTLRACLARGAQRELEDAFGDRVLVHGRSVPLIGRRVRRSVCGSSAQQLGQLLVEADWVDQFDNQGWNAGRAQQLGGHAA